MKQIVIQVEGGLVTGVWADFEDVQITIRDHDNIEAGDEDPFPYIEDAPGFVAVW